MAVKSIGEELRYERLRQGLTLDDIAQRTRISLRSLEAIESDEFERLPGVVFARNFVRLYAVDLKLDPESLVARLPRVDIAAAPMPDPPAGSGRTKRDPRITAAVASVLWLVTAGGAGTGAWYYFNRYGSHLMTTVAAAPAPMPAVQAKSVGVSPARLSPDTSATMQMAPAPSGVLQQTPDNSRPVQVILTAHEIVWVQASADGKTAFTGTLHPNDTRTVAADAQVKLLIGNAGGLDISLNGKPLDPVGPRGQTRTVRLTAAGPQFGPQNPRASSPL